MAHSARKDEDENIYVDDVELEEDEQEEEDEEDRLYMEMALEEEQRSKAAVSTPRAPKPAPVVTARPSVAELPPLPENSSGCARSEPYRKIPDIEKVRPRVCECE